MKVKNLWLSIIIIYKLCVCYLVNIENIKKIYEILKIIDWLKFLFVLNSNEYII